MPFLPRLPHAPRQMQAWPQPNQSAAIQKTSQILRPRGLLQHRLVRHRSSNGLARSKERSGLDQNNRNGNFTTPRAGPRRSVRSVTTITGRPGRPGTASMPRHDLKGHAPRWPSDTLPKRATRIVCLDAYCHYVSAKSRIGQRKCDLIGLLKERADSYRGT
jgi:hypothetical protein